MQTRLVVILHFLLDETPAVASQPLHFTSQLLFFTTLYPSFCAQVTLTDSAFMLALHLCVFHFQSVSNRMSPIHGFPASCIVFG